MSPLALAAAALLAGAGPALTEAEAVELALRASPALKALAAQLDETRALEDAAGRWNNPELRIQKLRSDRLIEPGLRQATYPDHPLEGARVGLRWEPPRPGVASAREAEAAAETARAEADRELARRAIEARARARHAKVRLLDLALESAQAERDLRERTRRALERRVEQGAATALDLSAAAVDALEAAEVAERLEIERARALSDLLALLALPAGSAPALSADGAVRCEAPEASPLLARAAAGDPSQGAFRAEIAAADAERSRRWLALVPWPSHLQASYVFRGDADPAYWTFQLGFELPLLDWKRAERRAFAARKARLEAERTAEAAELGHDVRHALARLGERAARVRRYAGAAAALEEAAARFDAIGPAASTVQAAQLRARVLAARRARAEAELECTLERIELDRLTGAAAAPAAPAP